MNKSNLLPVSLTLIENFLILLNIIPNNELPIIFVDFSTTEKGPDSNRTGHKTFLRLSMITRSRTL